jgi:hypothetical protein
MVCHAEYSELTIIRNSFPPKTQFPVNPHVMRRAKSLHETLSLNNNFCVFAHACHPWIMFSISILLLQSTFETGAVSHV